MPATWLWRRLAEHGGVPIGAFDGLCCDRRRDVVGLVLGPGLEGKQPTKVTCDLGAVGSASGDGSESVAAEQLACRLDGLLTNTEGLCCFVGCHAGRGG